MSHNVECIDLEWQAFLTELGVSSNASLSVIHSHSSAGRRLDARRLSFESSTAGLHNNHTGLNNRAAALGTTGDPTTTAAALDTALAAMQSTGISSGGRCIYIMTYIYKG